MFSCQNAEYTTQLIHIQPRVPWEIKLNTINVVYLLDDEGTPHSSIQRRRQQKITTPTYSTRLSFLYINESHEPIYYTINQPIIIHTLVIKHGVHCMGYKFLLLYSSLCCSISILSTTTRSKQMPCWRLGSGEAPIPPTILQVVPSGLVLLAMLLEASQRLICTLPENQKNPKKPNIYSS